MPRTWEYDWVNAGGNELVKVEYELDKMGKEGWELAATFPMNGSVMFLMKRESSDIPPKEKESKPTK